MKTAQSHGAIKFSAINTFCLGNQRLCQGNTLESNENHKKRSWLRGPDRNLGLTTVSQEKKRSFSFPSLPKIWKNPSHQRRMLRTLWKFAQRQASVGSIWLSKPHKLANVESGGGQMLSGTTSLPCTRLIEILGGL